MKIKIFILFLFLNFGTSITEKASAQNVSVSFQVFYDDLSPYGTWVNSPAYGYVWIPNEGAGFSPYATNGYWAYTDYGWTWVSYYSWGWAPFHYGRWYSDPIYGHCWIPGHEWGPGWVSWRYTNGYYGWASMGPGSYYVPDDHWTFVQINYFGSTTINNHYGPRGNNSKHIKNSTIINNSHKNNITQVTYNAGPDRGQVEKHNGKKINTIFVKESGTHGQSIKNNELHMYKPSVEKNNAGGVKRAPKKVTEMKDVKPNTQQKQPNTQQQVPKTQQTQPQKEYKPVGNSKQQPVKQPQPKQEPTQPKSQQQPNTQQQMPKEQPHQQMPKTQQQQPKTQQAPPKSQQQPPKQPPHKPK